MRNKLLVSTLVVLLFGVLVWSLMNRGYGKVSPQAYKYAMAIYGACRTQDPDHLAKVKVLLEANAGEDPSTELTEEESRWLREIVNQAEQGNWETASRKARRMLEDQVEY